MSRFKVGDKVEYIGYSESPLLNDIVLTVLDTTSESIKVGEYPKWVSDYHFVLYNEIYSQASTSSSLCTCAVISTHSMFADQHTDTCPSYLREGVTQ